jgi:hypothetical protein
VADYAFYWQQYLNESGDDGRPRTGWLTSRDWLVKRLHHGDRAWLFIGGDACGDEEGPHRAYVAQLLVVDGWGNYEDHEPGVRGSPRFEIHGIEDRCILVQPPALVDSIFRRPGSDPEQHIGVARQTPFELDGGRVAEVLALLRDRYPEVHAVAIQV